MKKILLGIFIVFVLGIIIGSFKQPINNFIQYDENLTLALYNENGEKIDQIPSKDSGYTLDTELKSLVVLMEVFLGIEILGDLL